MDKLAANLRRYINKYDATLVQVPNYQERIKFLKEDLKYLPVTHSIHIDDLSCVMVKGLRPHSVRNRKGTHSALGHVDFQYGLNNYIFANLGVIPPYRSDSERCTILVDPDIVKQERAFFTFTDLVNAIRGTEFYTASKIKCFEEKRIRKRYECEKMPLWGIFDVLARTFLAKNMTIEDFLLPENYFPTAMNNTDLDIATTLIEELAKIYQQFGTSLSTDEKERLLESELSVNLSGNPEIKLTHVPPNMFTGFCVADNSVLETLLERGISRKDIILLSGSNEKRLLYEHIKKLKAQPN